MKNIKVMESLNNEFICRYCGKIKDTYIQLRRHENRCKFNKNRCNNINHGTTGHKWITNGKEQLFMPKEDVEPYITSGWRFGQSDIVKNRRKGIATYKYGIASTQEKEKERKLKISLAMKGNKNWMFNKTRGNGKKGWYHGIFCDSSWELAYVVYHIEHKLSIKRSSLRLEYFYNNKKHIYIPDFETSEGIIEIKGRKTKQSEEKRKQYPDIKVIDKESIKMYLDYVIEKYGNNFWEILYEK